MTGARRMLWLLPLVVGASCGGATNEAKGPWPKARTAQTAAAAEPDGFVFRLSEGTPPPPERAKVASGEPLDAKATAAVLSRLPPMTKEPEGEKAFALRDASKPPPRPGKTVTTPFPPARSAPPAEPTASGPLRVLRVAPSGEVALAPTLTITFSQPMVPVTAVADLERSAVPVKLSPEPRGKWRWLGTKTLTFEPSPRFPMATEYRVEVPAGARSAAGTALAETYVGKFATPAPRVTRALPTGGSARPDAVMLAEFDQRVDPARVLPTVHVTSGSKPIEVRAVSLSELRSAPGFADVADELAEGRWIAFRPTRPMPNDSKVTVTVGPHTPSAEGPRTTTAPHSWSFKTFGALRLVRHGCGGPPEGCRPGMPFTLEFSNPISSRRFDKAMVRVSPELPGMKAEVWGNSVGVTGRAKARTKYRVAVAPTLEDEFGQPLGAAKEVEIEVGTAEPSLSGGNGGMVVLDPAGGGRFSVYSVNHDTLAVRAWAVGPEHWDAFAKWQQRDRRTSVTPPGKAVMNTTVDVAGDDDELVETRIDLKPVLRNGLGQVVISVAPPGKNPGDPGYQAVEAWIQSTRIGLDAFVDAGELVGWASALSDGKPLGGVELTLWPGNARGTTAADGVARVALGTAGAGLLVARKGDDVALLPEHPWGGGSQGSWQRQSLPDDVRFYVFDDRGMYRPGEEVKFKGWVRRIGLSEGGDVAPIGDLATGVRWSLRDAQNNALGSGTAKLSALGGFDGSIKLPKTPNLGQATLELSTTGGAVSYQRTHMLAIQEFRRPEFEVTTTAPAGPHFLGGHLDVAASASYYAGGGLSDAEMEWSVTATPGSFSPPNREDFTFGRWTPWWEFHGRHGMRGMPGMPGMPSDDSRTKTYKARTDGAGKHHLRIDLVAARPPRPTNITAQATVQDKNRQAWSSSSTVLVHPAANYVGLRAPRPFVQQGEAMVVDAIVTDLDGKAVAGRPVAMRSVRIDSEIIGGEPVEHELDPETCDLTSTADVVRCTFRPKEPGTWRVTAVVTDAVGRKNESQMTLWVAGERLRPSRELSQDRVELVPGKRSYRRGDIAEVLVLAPFSPAEGLMTLRRGGIVKTERFTISRGSYTLRIPIDDSYVPGVEVQVDLVGAAPRTDDAGEPAPSLPKRPAFAGGSVQLQVPPLERTLALTATPREAALEPGAQTVVDIQLKDAAGRPVSGAEVAVVVVDEAVLSLSGYKLADPIGVFYASRGSPVRDHHSRERVLLARPEDVLAAAGRGPASGQPGYAQAPAMAPPPPPQPPEPQAKMMRMEADASGKDAAAPIRMRTDFNALATFAPAVPTGADGRAAVTVKLPDNLTRYRVMAVAVAGDKAFGSGESAITARLPLMVRPSPPRFLNFGDRFELAVLLQNQTAQPLDVDVAVRAANLAMTSGAGRRVKVPAGDRVEVRFPAAAQSAGTARFQIGAVSGKRADAAEGKLPVWTPATTEAFATYGEIDQGAIAQPVAAPSGAVAEFGGLEITTSSTAVSALSDAMLYLSRYPFECAEQIASRVVAVAALRDVLAAFRAEGLPPPAALEGLVQRDLDRLATLQNGDGGFGFWRRGDASWPYVSVHVAHALARAQAKRFAVPAPMLEQAKGYLRSIETRLPREYPEAERRTIIAYALFTRAKLGDRDVARARRLVTEAGDKLPIESAGFLLAVLSGAAGAEGEVGALRKMLESRVTETAGAAHFATSYTDGEHLLMHSERRADAIVLEALIGDQPKSDLIPKLVQGLLAHRTAGRWTSTQENAFVLLALDRYFATYEKVTPDFVARAWLGPKFAGEHTFKGRTTERHHVEVPMQEVLQGAASKDLVIEKAGAGRLYYRVGLRYAPKSLTLPPTSQGFTVERAYAAVDDPRDVRRDPDGTWRVKAGARVRVKLSLLAPTRRYHVALVDPLPAGLEPENPALAVTAAIPDSGATTKLWWGPWYQHQNLRDERAEAFTTLLAEGLYAYEYLARATTPGTFVVPPPKAEEMYSPETFGRGAGDKLVVE